MLDGKNSAIIVTSAGWGPAICGHAPSRGDRRPAFRSLDKGTSFWRPLRPGDVGGLVIECGPQRGDVRFVNYQTPASSNLHVGAAGLMRWPSLAARS